MRSRQSFRFFAGLTGLMLVVFLSHVYASMPVISSGGQEAEPGTEINKLIAVGGQAPTNSLRGIDNKDHLFPVAGQWNMVFFWSLFCHSCIEEMPALQARLADLNDKGLKAFFVSLDSEKMQRALENFCKSRNLSQPVLMEKIASDSFVTADQWGVVMTPSVFIVAPDGKIAYSHQGPMDMEKFFTEFAVMSGLVEQKEAQEQ